MRPRQWPDWLGSCISMACALHCASLTVIFTLYPALWLNRRYWEMGLWQKLFWLERGLFVVTCLIWFVAISMAWRHHRHPGPAVLGSLSLMALGVLIFSPLHFSGQWTGIAAVVAGVGIVLSHIGNLVLSRQQRQANLTKPAPKITSSKPL